MEIMNVSSRMGLGNRNVSERLFSEGLVAAESKGGNSAGHLWAVALGVGSWLSVLAPAIRSSPFV